MKIFRFLCRKEINELEKSLDYANRLLEESQYECGKRGNEIARLEEDKKAILARCNLFERELRARPAQMKDQCYMNALSVIQQLRDENAKLKEANFNLEQQLKKKAKRK